MPLAVPNLDDRRWADLVDDARALIPRLAPHWTDHNIHDPGITFIELFAWLAEMQIYQLNRIGDRHREVFGRLAGVRRRARTPARVDLFVAGNLSSSLTLPAETQLTPLEGDEIVFETTQAVPLTRSRLRRVIVDDGSGPLDQTEANERSGVAFLAFGERARPGTQLQLGFDRFYPDDEPTLRVSFELFTADLGARCGAETPVAVEVTSARVDVPPAVDLAWEYRGAGDKWRPLTVLADESRALSRSGAVTLEVPNAAVAHHAHVWMRARIARGSYDIEPRLSRVALNGIPCRQNETVRDEMLGRGTGRPNQSFVLDKGPIFVVDGEPAVTVEVEGERWESVTSLEHAGPSSRQFEFDLETRCVRFGNGVNGQMPRPGQVIRALKYRTTGGAGGNVSSGLTWKFRTSVVPGVIVTNPQPALGGVDAESLADLELRARAVLNRPSRAVTLSDLERLALGTPEVHVARAAAIPDCPSPGRITVVVMSKARPGRTGPPSPPSRAFVLAVNRHLQTRRLLGDDLRVVPTIYIAVRVVARLRLAKGAGAESVVERARHALDRFFDGEDPASAADQRGSARPPSPCPTRWPFGRAVYPSEVYAVLDRVAGVDAVASLRLAGGNNGRAPGGDAPGAVLVPRIGVAIAGAYDLAVDLDGARSRG
jgi:hypothetical protein